MMIDTPGLAQRLDSDIPPAAQEMLVAPQASNNAVARDANGDEYTGSLEAQ